MGQRRKNTSQTQIPIFGFDEELNYFANAHKITKRCGKEKQLLDRLVRQEQTIIVLKANETLENILVSKENQLWWRDQSGLETLGNGQKALLPHTVRNPTNR